MEDKCNIINAVCMYIKHILYLCLILKSNLIQIGRTYGTPRLVSSRLVSSRRVIGVIRVVI